jgi:hypothetical protein
MKALQSVCHQSQEMEGFGMVGRESKRLPVGGFCFNETTLALVKSSLVQPAVDRGPVGLSACGFLTASLGSIHDASAADRSVTEKRGPVKGIQGRCGPGAHTYYRSKDENYKIGRLSIV